MTSETHGFSSFSEAYDAFDRTCSALTTFTTLLSAAIFHEPSALQKQGSGVSVILDQQIEDLREIGEAFLQEFHALKNDNETMEHNHKRKFINYINNIKEMERISDISGVDVTTIRAALSCALSSPLFTDKPTPKERRDRFIAEQLKEGVSEADISQAVGVKKSAVERVRRELEAETATATDAAPDTEAAAVNG